MTALDMTISENTKAFYWKFCYNDHIQFT